MSCDCPWAGQFGRTSHFQKHILGPKAFRKVRPSHHHDEHEKTHQLHAEEREPNRHERIRRLPPSYAVRMGANAAWMRCICCDVVMLVSSLPK
jgi:transposase